MQTINIFLSHRWSNDDEYQTIKEWLNEPNYANFKLYSVSKEEGLLHKNKCISDKDLCERLEKRIQVSSIFLCFNDKSYSSENSIGVNMN